jgi:chromosome segregation ATPase
LSLQRQNVKLAKKIETLQEQLEDAKDHVASVNKKLVKMELHQKELEEAYKDAKNNLEQLASTTTTTTSSPNTNDNVTKNVEQNTNQTQNEKSSMEQTNDRTEDSMKDDLSDIQILASRRLEEIMALQEEKTNWAKERLQLQQQAFNNFIFILNYYLLSFSIFQMNKSKNLVPILRFISSILLYMQNWKNYGHFTRN